MSYLSGTMVGANAFEKHLISNKRKGGKSKRGVGFILMLTSMVDMFSMLVIFLLQTFSSSPEIIITSGLKLPDSFTPSIVREAPIISLNKDGNLYLDQVKVGIITEMTKNPQPVLQKLDAIKRNWAKSHPNGEFPGQINLQADKDIPSSTVSKVMNILTAGQFSSIQLAVIGQR
jgi:biopolymer transport protein ExbD